MHDIIGYAQPISSLNASTVFAATVLQSPFIFVSFPYIHKDKTNGGPFGYCQLRRGRQICLGIFVLSKQRPSWRPIVYFLAQVHCHLIVLLWGPYWTRYFIHPGAIYLILSHLKLRLMIDNKAIASCSQCSRSAIWVIQGGRRWKVQDFLTKVLIWY